MLLGGMGAAVAYVVQRCIEAVQSGPTDPTLILATSHVAFYWRASTAAWWGVVIAGVTYAWLVRTERGTAGLVRWLGWVVVPLAAVLAFFAWWMP
jgi:hypothetical protein